PGTITKKVVAAPIRANLPVEQVNVTATGTSGVVAYEISSDENYSVYLQDQDTSGKPELYSRELDTDADGVINASDNCPFIANASQGALVFPVTVTMSNSSTFTWGAAMDVRYVRGPISRPFYQTNLSGTLIEATKFSDPALPAVGTGFYYMFAVDCAG